MEKEQNAKWGEEILSGRPIVGPAHTLYHSWMSANLLCCLFSKCKNSNKSTSSDSLLEGPLELTQAFVYPGVSTQCLLAFPDVFIRGGLYSSTWTVAKSIQPHCLSPGSDSPSSAFLLLSWLGFVRALFPAEYSSAPSCMFLLELHNVGAGICCVV